MCISKKRRWKPSSYNKLLLPIIYPKTYLILHHFLLVASSPFVSRLYTLPLLSQGHPSSSFSSLNNKTVLLLSLPPQQQLVFHLQVSVVKSLSLGIKKNISNHGILSRKLYACALLLASCARRSTSDLDQIAGHRSKSLPCARILRTFVNIYAWPTRMHLQ